MPETPELTEQEWQYISMLIAADLRIDRAAELDRLVAMHQPIWEKIQPACNWDGDDE